MARQGLMPRYCTRFDVVEGWYWWLAEHHEGQWSEKYMRLCRMSKYFKPGRMSHAPESDVGMDIYISLCEKEGCTHPPFEEE